ncbi:hypothetical protein QJU96_05835 [Pasteurella skyensis]|uniref:Inner membrane protein yeeR n=1 Tax=Phocoenobacter skyensis TaxID=97481 RepID=A0AAJ6NDM5_9PAST|nr:hypothetical protein [Pasteurella skyensis]MDP8170803.1 hypothetical protein [Pasteurella skyensis]MDP8174879.1 hypothetical protein [Pasteurella skyensis]
MKKEKSDNNAELIGIAQGNIQSAQNYSDNVKIYDNPTGGHGFAAEKTNHLFDKITGKKAHIIGDDNTKNGADRLVNGVEIQTKFCRKGGDCIKSCIDKATGKFRYWDQNGNPMKIEVPKDVYDNAIKSFEERVRRGQVVDISGMSKSEIENLAKQLAKDTIIKSPFTYQQIKNITKFGTIESLTFDAINGIRVAGTTMGVSALVSFAYAMWSGKDYKIALKESCYTGLKVGGISWVSSIITSQIAKTGIVKGLKPATGYLVEKMGSKTASIIANSSRVGQSSIYGAAAMNSASKLLRGNIITGAVTTIVISVPDFYKMFMGYQSGKQVAKNVTTTTAGVLGGTAGWIGGVALVSGVTTGGVAPIIAGLVSSVAVGSGSSSLTKTILDYFSKDDIVEMQEILAIHFNHLAEDYLLSQQEAESVLDGLSEKLSIEVLQDMFKQESKRNFAIDLIEPLIIDEVRKRKVIKIAELPTIEKLEDEIEIILDDNLIKGEA